MTPAPRHHLLWLTEAAWTRLQAQSQDSCEQAVLARWRQMRWPVVVRRAEADAGADELCVGIALPPDAQGNKPRLALRVQRAEVAASHAPYLLRDIAAARLHGLPQGWQAGMEALQQQMQAAGIALAVFGSLSWQAITAQAYVRSSSDIDLLFAPDSQAQLAQGLQLLARQAAMLPLDGEIVFPDGAAVSWKEWQQVMSKETKSDARVMVKRPAAVALEPVAQLLAALAAREGQACVV
ncbi:malonate decarboxylase holo-[acyl-carrier-protein] synthase [Herbaspirillum seropedicae]|uniref:malonate decarboxylase holo-[acyl-carrier-protein] synthase n=1 Tax=Herbaspirillum seropedicae TaxID=964 RepID=UPI0031D628B3